MVKIVQKDEKAGKVLREKAEAIDFAKISPEKLTGILDDMREAMYSQNDGVALAAPQIGLSLRIFIIHPMAYDEQKIKTKDRKLVFINPKIIKISKDKKLVEEGCLSVRPIYGRVRRSSRATIKAYDEKGQEFEMEGRGLLAQIFQHETDHLEGILFTDKAKELFELE